MPRGARKGEARSLGTKRIPDAVRNKLEEQEAAAAMAKRSRAAAGAGAVAEKTKESDPFREYNIEPVGKSYPHVKQAEQYARDVISGKIIACEWAVLACKRFFILRDNPEIIFDGKQAERFCRFAESFPHVKGSWKTRNITLEPWEILIGISIFGFYWKRDRTRRVVKLAYVEVPRKNAKSTLAAIIGLYMLTEQDEPGAEVYSAATTHKQALAVFDTARAMARRQFAFAAKHDIIVQAKDIKIWGTLAKFEALHAQGETLDGLNIFCSIVDELHAHRNRDVYDVLETAMGARRSPLMFCITTAGSNRAGVCYQTRNYIIKCLRGQVDDPTTFGIIYSIDAEDIEQKNFYTPAIWKKANPNYGVSISEDELERLARKAATSPVALGSFLTKHLNVWVGAAHGWLDMTSWDKQYDESLDEKNFAGEKFMGGLDLASKVDLASYMRIYRRKMEDGQYHFFVFGNHYIPEGRLNVTADETDDNADAYAGWREEGWLTVTPGRTIDMDAIEGDILSSAKQAQAGEIGYDPQQATQLVGHMSKEQLNMVELRQNFLTFSEPMKVFQKLVLDGRIHHNGDPVLAWALANVVVEVDKKENYYPTKEFPDNKIDPAVATFLAMNRWVCDELNEEEPSGESVYSQGSLYREAA
jgi:phage terminase large subunit-like protein